MPIIIHELPFIEKGSELLFPTGTCRVNRDQIILWISILEPDVIYDKSEGYPYFPVLLDTGFSHNLQIHEHHVRFWAGTEVGAFKGGNEPAIINGMPVPIRDANIVIYKNVSGAVTPDLSLDPTILELDGGVAMQESQPISPRLPLLGMRALRISQLQIHIDCQRSIVTIIAPD